MAASFTPHPPAPVAIVGAGPVGMLSALLLAQKGVRSVLFERREKLSLLPKAMSITRRTGEIFRRLGLWEKLQERSLPMEGRDLAIWSHTLVGGDELGRTPFSGLLSAASPCIPLHCPQTTTEAVLLEALRAEPLAEVCFNHEIVGVTGRPDGVRLSMLSPEGAGEYFFPYLLAADGAGSTTRHLLEIPADGPGDMGHFLNVYFRADFGQALNPRKAMLYQAICEEYFEFFVAVNGIDLWLMHHYLQPGETPADYPSKRLAELIGRASGLAAAPVEILAVTPWAMSPKVASRFRQGRTLLVGDAAARLSPSGGLGMNTGLQSADNLAWKLAALLKGEASETLLESYHTERRAASLATLNHTDDNAGEIFAIAESAFKGDWPGVRQKIAHSRRNGSGLGIDLGTAYESGAFIAEETPFSLPADPGNNYTPSARPGARAPHLWIGRDGRRISTLDLFGDGFTLLAGRQGKPWQSAALLAAVYRNGDGFTDESGDFEPLYGIHPDGAVLVRPDGVVAARFPKRVDDPLEAVRGALKTILGQENLPRSL